MKIKSKKNKAGGFPAVYSSIKHIFKETGTIRGTSSLLKVNQMDGFDCPGCAWPDPDDRRSMTEFCENGAKAIAEEATREKVDPSFFSKFTIDEMRSWSDYKIGKSGRISHPMIKTPGSKHFEPIGWEEAFKKIADTLKSLPNPDRAIFYTSGRTSNEAAFLYQLLVRRFGTNNLPDCSNLCHESSGVGLKETIGLGKGTVTLDDFNHADLILVIGQNPGTNHPRMLSSLQEAKRKGAKIISINPLNEAGSMSFAHPQEMGGMFGVGTKLNDLFVPVAINGDVALLKGVIKYLIENDIGIDRPFIKNKTCGFEELEKDVLETPWCDIEEGSGLSQKQIEELAVAIGESKRMICCWAMGLTQHVNGVANIQMVSNLLLMGGHFGKRGAGACPVRGHSNVQGDRTMGIWERPSESFLAPLDREFKFKSPREHGYDVVEALKAMYKDDDHVFMAMGGNLLSAGPNTDYCDQAISNCQLSVHVSTKLNRTHLVKSAETLILPCLGRTEKDEAYGANQFVTVENSMGVVHKSTGHLRPISNHLKSEVEIICRLAEYLWPEEKHISWGEYRQDYSYIRDSIGNTVSGFENFNIKIQHPGGFYLPNAVRDDCRFETESGLGEFKVHAIPMHQLGQGEFHLMTVRSHDQYNTTIYGLDDRYRGVYNGRDVVFMNSEDMADLKISDGDKVDLHSSYPGHDVWLRSMTAILYDIPRKNIASYFPECNPLIPVDLKAIKSNTPASKSVKISIVKA